MRRLLSSACCNTSYHHGSNAAGPRGKGLSVNMKFQVDGEAEELEARVPVLMSWNFCAPVKSWVIRILIVMLLILGAHLLQRFQAHATLGIPYLHRLLTDTSWQTSRTQRSGSSGLFVPAAELLGISSRFGAGECLLLSYLRE
eukprot:TRINITY_DN65379_c0_g1_i1.p1 TRINITY_DN65379_c0_g1~~TRINITY_DN65379_c0_g1_i1.p1  ORF type:complete len:143 (-),score=4.05 TRINITY_DN65379_c0_g1_i1:72-500(-)